METQCPPLSEVQHPIVAIKSQPRERRVQVTSKKFIINRNSEPGSKALDYKPVGGAIRFLSSVSVRSPFFTPHNLPLLLPASYLLTLLPIEPECVLDLEVGHGCWLGGRLPGLPRCPAFPLSLLDFSTANITNHL